MSEQTSVKVDIAGQSLIADARTFSSGSRGFYASGKVAFGENGKRYQCSISIVEIGSKPGKAPVAASAPAVKNGKVALS